MEKHILFYSNFCEFSKEVIRDVTKKDLRSRFVFICIDDNRHKLPDIVDRVPTIVSNSHTVFIEDDIPKFLMMLRQIDHNQVKPQQNQSSNMGQGQPQQGQQGQQEQGISPYSHLDMSNKISDNFSYIENENGNGVNNGFSEHTFASLNDDHRINYTEEATSSGSKLDSGMLEKYMAQRDLEFSNVRKNQPKFT